MYSNGYSTHEELTQTETMPTIVKPIRDKIPSLWSLNVIKALLLFQLNTVAVRIYDFVALLFCYK